MSLAIVCVMVLITMVLVMIAAYRGPTTYDRLLAANLFGTKTMVLIALLTVFWGDMMYLDVALVYALVNFIATLALLKYFKYHGLGDVDAVKKGGDHG